MNAPLLADDCIRIRGARVHNLRGIDLDLPRNRLIVVTGPSGSGKSSLAFDTLFAEGQRQYIESLSTYARQFFAQLERPDVDLIDGLQPTICVDQRPASPNPRSTVATVTEIQDYLRLLMARVGEMSCVQCGAPLRQQSPDEIENLVLRLPHETRAMILAPLVRGRKGAHQDVLTEIRKARLVRVRVDGTIYDIDAVPSLSPRQNHDIDAVIDRVIIRESSRSRIGESIRQAVAMTAGLVNVTYFDLDIDEVETSDGEWRDRIFSTKMACIDCGLSFPEIEPRTFSFNSPYGACPTCDGIGTIDQYDPDLVLPDESLTLAEGAVAAWRTNRSPLPKAKRTLLEPLLSSLGRTLDEPLAGWSDHERHDLFYGAGKTFAGVFTLLEKERSTTTKAARQEELGAYRNVLDCPECGGARLRAEARSVRLGGLAIHEIAALPIDRGREFFRGLEIRATDALVARPLLLEIDRRLDFLQRVGLGYLTLERGTDTLSGGELQRVRLATGIGSGLVGVLYILDEPTIGLHPSDNERLLASLRELQQQGNTVLVVEHDEATMRAADYLIDVGPGAGRFGGEILAAGTPAEVLANPRSVTAPYLTGAKSIPRRPQPRDIDLEGGLHLTGARLHNLRGVNLTVPLGALVCVSGVSGSGKSSLINGTLAPAVGRALGQTARKPGPFSALTGVERIDKLVIIDQAPLGRSSRSNPATYTGLWDEVRSVFAATREAKSRGFKSKRFSFNAKGGRCEACHGQGEQRIEMNFLPDLRVPCEVCGGRRFNAATLAVRYRGKTIADILEMPVGEARAFFENVASIHRPLEALGAVGLDYLPLGQPATTLSGGEAQRIKLAAELAREATGRTLYILDEPTTGLHFEDVARLLEVLQRLVDLGNTVLLIEHHQDVIAAADWVVTLGPGGGEAGGQIVAASRPAEN